MKTIQITKKPKCPILEVGKVYEVSNTLECGFSVKVVGRDGEFFVNNKRCREVLKS